MTTASRAITLKTAFASALTALLICGTSSAFAKTAEETKAFVEKAVAHIEAVGQKQAFADFSRPDGGFIDGELYMFCFTPDGTTQAHGGNAALLGKNLMSIKDPDGFASTAALIKTGMEQGSGWVEFKWPNPTTKKVEQKAAYVVKVGDRIVCGSGYYKG
ncbi:cache domain-containing protein [Rhodospirillaceae bacterium SYSU D60014]|uniref:cache domain-containing protein n=1 Tax=Virgifigura deserti TaxID=2268457 RepID=UPI0013C4BF98